METTQLRVLVIAPDPDTRARVRRCAARLHQLQIDLHCIASPDGAQTSPDGGGFDLILADLQGREGLGTGVIRRLLLSCADAVAHRERALAQSDQRYRRLLSVAGIYAYWVKVRGGIPISTEHGPGCTEVTGYGPEDYAADPYLWIRMVHPDDRDTVRGHVDRILKGEEVSVLEHRIVHRDGTVRWLRDRIIGRRDDAGQLVGYEGLVEDVTRERELTTKLHERDIELRAARRTQERFLPSAPPVVPGLDVFGASYTRGFSGGDLFDYLAMPGQSLGFVIGDVTGHEFASALLMTSTCATLRLLADTEPDVEEILKRTNRSLLNEASGQFVTLLLARLDPDKRRLVYVNAGHPAGRVLDAAGHPKASLESTAVPLGVLSDNRFPSAPPVDLEPGDTLLLLTDGLPEAVSPHGELFGIDRTMEVLRALRDRPAREIVESLYESVCRFCSPGQPADDVTLVVIKVFPEPRASAQHRASPA